MLGFRAWKFRVWGFAEFGTWDSRPRIHGLGLGASKSRKFVMTLKDRKTSARMC